MPSEKETRKEKAAEQAEAGKLVNEEKSQIGVVKWSVYIMFVKQMGYKITAWMVAFFIVFSSFGSAGNFWLSSWAEDYKIPEYIGNLKQRDFRLGIFGMFAGVQCKTIIKL